jgi:hypothetical protein
MSIIISRMLPLKKLANSGQILLPTTATNYSYRLCNEKPQGFT